MCLVVVKKWGEEEGEKGRRGECDVLTNTQDQPGSITERKEDTWCPPLIINRLD